MAGILIRNQVRPEKSTTKNEEGSDMHRNTQQLNPVPAPHSRAV